MITVIFASASSVDAVRIFSSLLHNYPTFYRYTNLLAIDPEGEALTIVTIFEKMRRKARFLWHVCSAKTVKVHYT